MNRKLRFISFMVCLVVMISSLAQVSYAEETIKLKKGFNFISFTGVPDPAPSKFKALNVNIENIFVFMANISTFLSLKDNDPIELKPALGVIVKTLDACDVSLPLTALSTLGNITVYKGYNIVGFSKAPGSNTFKKLMDKYPTAIQSMHKWDPALNSFVAAVRTSTTGSVELVDGLNPDITAGEAYYIKFYDNGMSINLDGSDIVINGAPAPAVKTLASITLSKTTDEAEVGSTYNLANILETALYEDETTSSVNAVWKINETALTNENYVIPDGLAEIIFTAEYTEGAVTKTATFKISTKPASGIKDIAISSFSKKALIAINMRCTEDATTQEVGTLPANVPANAPVSLKFPAPTASFIKDLQNRKVSFGPSYASRPKITDSTTTYTFITVETEDTTIEVAATRKYNGTSCYIFLADSVTDPGTDWDKVGKQFDEKINPVMLSNYGAPSDIDGNGKVIILYFPMKKTSTMGYFHQIDLYPGYANDMEVFYMNINWGGSFTDPLNAEMVRTLAHEYQHLINYGQRQIYRKLTGMNTWMDEGLAESAEQIVAESVGLPAEQAIGKGRLDTFKADDKNLLKNGLSLSMWDGSDEAYAQAYLFMQYIKNQSSAREAMFKEIVTYTKPDYSGIEDIMKKYSSFTTFSDILISYRVANLVNGAGIYGYGTDATKYSSYLNIGTGQGVQSPASLEGVKISGGAAIYVYPSAEDLNNFKPNGNSADIKFVRINK